MHLARLIATSRQLEKVACSPSVGVTFQSSFPEAGDSVKLLDSEFHHLKNVLRLEQAEKFLVYFSDLKRTYLCELQSQHRKSNQAIIRKEIHLPRPVTSTTLFCGLIKPKICDLIVEKSSELGVSNVYFFSAERSQIHLTSSEKDKFIGRCLRIRDAALKQSLTAISPDINLFSSLVDLLNGAIGAFSPSLAPTPGIRLLCTAPDPKELLFAACDHPNDSQSHPEVSLFKSPTPSLPAVFISQLEIQKQCDDVHIVVGPEGGLTDGEIKLSKDYGFQSVSLGPNTLRTETAAILACGLCQSLCTLRFG